jgi:hypothetical protein
MQMEGQCGDMVGWRSTLGCVVTTNAVRIIVDIHDHLVGGNPLDVSPQISSDELVSVGKKCDLVCVWATTNPNIKQLLGPVGICATVGTVSRETKSPIPIR